MVTFYGNKANDTNTDDMPNKVLSASASFSEGINGNLASIVTPNDLEKRQCVMLYDDVATRNIL